MIEELIIARNSYHGRIVGSIAEFRNVDCPAILFLIFIESIPQPVVRRDSTSNCNMLNSRFFNGKFQFLHQDGDNCMLQTCGQVLLILFDEIRILLYPFPQIIKERGFQP